MGTSCLKHPDRRLLSYLYFCFLILVIPNDFSHFPHSWNEDFFTFHMLFLVRIFLFFYSVDVCWWVEMVVVISGHASVYLYLYIYVYIAYMYMYANIFFLFLPESVVEALCCTECEFFIICFSSSLLCFLEAWWNMLKKILWKMIKIAKICIHNNVKRNFASLIIDAFHTQFCVFLKNKTWKMS